MAEASLTADQLAQLADAFVSDGFGVVHRKQASVYDVALRLPSAMGGLVSAEIEVLRRLTESPEKPYVVVLGGSKVSDKLGVIDNLLGKADKLLIGGGMVFTFLKAQGFEVGKSLLEEDQLDVCRAYLARAEETGVEIVLLVLFAVVMLFPVLWMLETALKETRDIYAVPAKLFSFSPTLDHLKDVFSSGSPVLSGLKNSVIVSQL